jgi:hypothetical protein
MAATHAMYSRASWCFLWKCFLDRISHAKCFVPTFLPVQDFLVPIRCKTYDSTDTVEAKIRRFYIRIQ